MKSHQSNQLTMFGLYSNTLHLQGPELIRSIAAAKTQRDKIFQIFNAMPTTWIAPHELSACFPQWPITSIRRAVTYMEQDNLLEKSTEPMKMGGYGTRTHCWKLKNQ